MNAVIYTDGHGTKVTTHEFVTSDSKYLIRGILDARINKVKISPVPALVCTVFGIIASILGVFHLLSDMGDNVYIGTILMTPNRVALLLGVIFLYSGLYGMLSLKSKYTVRIITAEGERDSLVSSKKEPVKRIVAALKSALQSLRKQKDIAAAP